MRVLNAKGPPGGLTFVELGNILLRDIPEAELLSGYGTLDPEWVGRYGIDYGDINPDGTLN